MKKSLIVLFAMLLALSTASLAFAQDGVLYVLCKNDLVFSTRGIKGGYCLARKPQDISIYDIMKATENSMVICPSIDNTPERWINRYYAKVQADIHQMLKSVTLFQVKQTAGDA